MDGTRCNRVKWVNRCSLPSDIWRDLILMQCSEAEEKFNVPPPSLFFNNILVCIKCKNYWVENYEQQEMFGNTNAT